MGRVYRSAQGKPVDIDSLRLVNEETIAVGNMRVNARGDLLGQGGQVLKTRNQSMDEQYQINTAQAHKQRAHAAQQAQRRAGATVTPNVPKVEVPQVDPSGQAFDNPEQQAVLEATEPLEPQMRGSLADSIAKQVTVNQEVLDPNKYKPKGPQRI